MAIFTKQFFKFVQPDAYLRLIPAELKLSDHGLTIAAGDLQIRTNSKGNFSFNLTPSHIEYDNLDAGINNVMSNSYNQAKWPRLDGTDEDGLEWSCGYVDPQIETIKGINTLQGSTSSLTSQFDRDPDDVARVEMIIPLSHLPNAPGTMHLVMGAHHQKVPLLGSTAWFKYDPVSRLLTVSALYTQELPQPYLDSWLCEPLRILLGCPIRPKIVIRVAHDKAWRNQVHILSNDLRNRWSGWWGMWRSHNSVVDGETFWDWYIKIFEYLAKYRDDEGHLQFEQNPITRFYTEIEESSLSTNWILALAHCGALEGLVKTLKPETKRDLNDEESERVTSLREHIKKWDGVDGHKVTKDEADLRGGALSSLARIQESTVARKLNELIEEDILTSSQVKAWKDVRHPIMHGELGDEFSTEERDAKIRELSNAIFSVTKSICQI